MGNRRNITRKLSASNQYYSKKKRKIGPLGKSLLVVVVILVVSLFIYEISSPISPNNPPLNVNTTPATPLSQEEQLKQQYQELLKRGQKYTDTERADSIKKAAIKIIEQEKKNNQINQTVQRPAANTSTKPSTTTTVREQQATPPVNTSSNTSTEAAAITGTPIAASTTQSTSNEPVEEVYYPAQSIRGTITSAADGAGISGVNVMVKGGSQSTVTNYNGAYSIDIAAGPGPRVLQFNYQGNRIERDIRPGRNTIDAKF